MKNILMNTEMTKAILDGRKVQTRRVLKSVKDMGVEFKNFTIKNDTIIAEHENDLKLKRFKQSIKDFIKQEAKYQKNEIIWVREPAKIYYCNRDYVKIRAMYMSDEETIQLDIPSRFCKQTKDGWLPNWMRRKKGIPNGCIKEMARIFLKVTNVRVERLQEISVEDCLAEGIVDPENIDDENFCRCTKDYRCVSCKKIFDDWYDLWNSTAPKDYKWENNPCVFVYEFERVEK